MYCTSQVVFQVNFDLVLARPRARREPLAAVGAEHLLPAPLPVDLAHVDLGKVHGGAPLAAEEALVVPPLHPVGPRPHLGRRHRPEVRRGELGPRVEALPLVAALVAEVLPDHDRLRDERLALAAEAVVREVAVKQDRVYVEVAARELQVYDHLVDYFYY